MIIGVKPLNKDFSAEKKSFAEAAIKHNKNFSVSKTNTLREEVLCFGKLIERLCLQCSFQEIMKG